MGNALLSLSSRSEKSEGGVGGREEEEEEEDDDDRAKEEDSTFTCDLCIEPMLLPSKKFKNRDRCAHLFCVDCMIKFIQLKVENNVAEIGCPALSCEEFLDPLSCRPIVPPALFVTWCDVLCESAVLGMDRCYCPNQSCSALIVNECGGSSKKSWCPNCKSWFCFQCKLPWHTGFRCDESGELRDSNDRAFCVLAETNRWMRCPQCLHFIEPIEGCKIVKCRSPPSPSPPPLSPISLRSSIFCLFGSLNC